MKEHESFIETVHVLHKYILTKSWSTRAVGQRLHCGGGGKKVDKNGKVKVRIAGARLELRTITKKALLCTITGINLSADKYETGK